MSAKEYMGLLRIGMSPKLAAEVSADPPEPKLTGLLKEEAEAKEKRLEPLHDAADLAGFRGVLRSPLQVIADYADGSADADEERTGSGRWPSTRPALSTTPSAGIGWPGNGNWSMTAQG
jgi:hypothetical protein